MPIERTLHKRLLAAARHFPVVTVTGPRQSGKTTLCRMAFPDKPYVSLEAPDVRRWAARDPRGFLAEHRGGAVFDEVQREPELLSYLQVEVDREPARGRFVLTGSANLALLGSVSQSLAGRTALLELLPLSLDELRRFPDAPADLWQALFRGGYPAPFDRGIPAGEWYGAYVGTYVERDVRQALNVGKLAAFQSFLALCAGRTAQLTNLSGVGADAGVTHATAGAWLSVLEAAYLVHRLPAFSANVRKRLVRAPKLHFVDSGLACWLLGIRDAEQLRHHPLAGAIFESWVVAEVLKAQAHAGERPRLHHYRDRKGTEVDLVVARGDTWIAVEAKLGQTVAGDFFRGLDAFAGTSGGRHSVERVVVYGGEAAQRREGVAVLPWSRVPSYRWT
jgi:predicted AAA+ superfamily ATPase